MGSLKNDLPYDIVMPLRIQKQTNKKQVNYL